MTDLIQFRFASSLLLSPPHFKGASLCRFEGAAFTVFYSLEQAFCPFPFLERGYTLVFFSCFLTEGCHLPRVQRPCHFPIGISGRPLAVSPGAEAPEAQWAWLGFLGLGTEGTQFWKVKKENQEGRPIFDTYRVSVNLGSPFFMPTTGTQENDTHTLPGQNVLIWKSDIWTLAH